jgi:hypothetical protein
VKMAPAMAAGVSKTLWTMDNIVDLIDAAVPAPAKRGPTKSGRKFQTETVPALDITSSTQPGCCWPPRARRAV